jgi:DNA modification methylase
VLDPFMGSGTVGRVYDEVNRDFVGYDLKEY